MAFINIQHIIQADQATFADARLQLGRRRLPGFRLLEVFRIQTLWTKLLNKLMLALAHGAAKLVRKFLTLQSLHKPITFLQLLKRRLQLGQRRALEHRLRQMRRHRIRLIIFCQAIGR